MPTATTLVIYMPGSDYGRLAQKLLESGWPQDIPCAIVSAASGARQQIRRTNLAMLPTETPLAPPALVIVGRVAARKLEEARKSLWQKFTAGGIHDRMSPLIF